MGERKRRAKEYASRNERGRRGCLARRDAYRLLRVDDAPGRVMQVEDDSVRHDEVAVFDGTLFDAKQ